MSSRIATMLFSVLLPVAAVAQSLSPPVLVEAQQPIFDRLLSLEASSKDGRDADQFVPLWASPDGRLLAVVAMSNRSGAPSLPPSPAFGGVSDLRVVDAAQLFSAGLRLRIDDGLHAGLTLGQQTAPAFLANDGSACAANACFATLASSTDSAARFAVADLAWSPSFDSHLELSLGLGVLRSDGPLPRIGAAHFLSSPIDLALLDGSQGTAYRLVNARNLFATGEWELGRNTSFDLSAALSHSELSPIWYGMPGSELDWNQTSLGLGVSKGSLRGSIVGRINSVGAEANQIEQRWGGIDLGLSWRTPWRGEVTVGAQNLWSVPMAPVPERDADASRARVPYVQYRQDL